MKEVWELLNQEAEAIKALIGRIDEPLLKAAKLCLECEGRVIVTGLGKSGLIGRKIAATLASTGTPSFFLHATEASHGDLGMVTDKDLVIVISKSGSTDEVICLIPEFKRLGVKLIAVTAEPRSLLAENSEVVLNINVREEGEPYGLIPTTSAIVSLAVGDALAVLLMLRKNIRKEDFGKLHPAGNLGRLLTPVGKIMHTGTEIPIVSPDASIKEGILEMTSKKMGVTLICEDRLLLGIFTDGDIRRTIQNSGEDNIMKDKLIEHATCNPKSITSETLVEEAVYIMEKNKITSLPVLDSEKKLIGIVHLHDILQRKIL
ncbi:KpsF/GutQ family sugar-phosphate isomerase [bacterium]|nr:KpsF/GutQ family sugar-phosphate isomerase [bacterium]